MSKILPGTVVHYNEIGRLMSEKSSRITGNPAAVNAHVGGQYFFSPHKMALEAHIHHTIHHSSLLGYLSSRAEEKEQPLAGYLRQFCPEKGHFIDLYEAYRDLWKNSQDRDLPFDDFLIKQSCQCIGSTGYLDFCHGQEESLYLMKNYFRNMGLPAHVDQVVMGTGFKNLFNTFLTALMTKDVRVDGDGRDYRESSRGTILVPRGHYQSLVKAPSFHNSRLKVIEKTDREHIREELERRGDIKAVYFSVVANPSGDIMPREQICGIADAVLEYNAEHLDNPVYVIADQVYNGSILKEGLEIFSIASVKTPQGNMFDYTITIVSPSKTLGYASARIGFACSGITIPGDRASLIDRMGVILGHEGSDGVEVSTEVGVVAAYAFSSQEWIEHNSRYIRSQLVIARSHIRAINGHIGRNFVNINDPDAGWYILSKIKKADLPSGITDSTDLMVFLMNYNLCRNDTGIICRPGSQFGYESPSLPKMDHLILRSTLAMTADELHEFFRRYSQAIVKLAALHTLENLKEESVELLRQSLTEVESFCERLNKDLMVPRDSPGLFPLIWNSCRADQVCEDLKKYTKRELNIILGA